MNAVIWLIAGGIVATVAFRARRWNAGRGLVVAVLIGAGAAYFGGSVLAPIFEAPRETNTADFNALALIVATCTALAASFLSNTLYERFGT